ncbi:hypothetical protein IGI37_001772 [Enterococcus sp. AZ194]|uniref:hypothetical protein n=1 Tax=Enterococcus sp. AZ194 TaxID=2774629 RepID=UPI003F1EF7D0
MHRVYIDIIISAIIEQYGTEAYFYKEQLQIEEEYWEAWKRGQRTFSSELMQKVKNLFSDYEWMLMNKVLRQTALFPEKRNLAVSEYKRLKTKIAQKWLQAKIGEVEMTPFQTEVQKERGFINLKVSIHYDEWGFDDSVSFRLPANIQQQIEGSPIGLLEWVNENLEETYTKDQEN